MSKISIYLTRHGKTIFNTMDRVQGWSDTPLTNEGKQVATALGRGLKDHTLDALYSSDAGRAIETANIILTESGQTNLELVPLENFREMYFGKYEGDPNPVLWDDILAFIGVKDMDALLADGHHFHEIVNTIAELDETGEAESWNEYSKRLQTGLDHVVEKALEKEDTDVMIVSHGLSIGSILSIIDETQEIVHVANSSISKIVYEDSNFTIESINDLSYVENGRKNHL